MLTQQQLRATRPRSSTTPRRQQQPQQQQQQQRRRSWALASRVRAQVISSLFSLSLSLSLFLSLSLSLSLSLVCVCVFVFVRVRVYTSINYLIKESTTEECKVRVMLHCSSNPKRFSLADNPQVLRFTSSSPAVLVVVLIQTLTRTCVSLADNSQLQALFWDLRAAPATNSLIALLVV